MSCKPHPDPGKPRPGENWHFVPGKVPFSGKQPPPNLLNLVLTFPISCFVTFHSLFGDQIQMCKCHSRTAVFFTPLPLGLFKNPSNLEHGKRKPQGEKGKGSGFCLPCCVTSQGAAQDWLWWAGSHLSPPAGSTLPDIGVLGGKAQHLQAEECWVFEADQLPQGKNSLQALLAPFQALQGKAARCETQRRSLQCLGRQLCPQCPRGDLSPCSWCLPTQHVPPFRGCWAG